MRFHERTRAEGRIAEMSWLDKAFFLAKYFWLHRVETPSPLPLGESPARSPRATLGFVGDLMWIRKNWGNFLSPSARSHSAELDGLVGNLETPISTRIPVNEFWPDLWRFNSDPRLLTSFRRADGSNLFAALSFANNHTLDHGDPGALDTLALLAQEKIPQSGVALPGSPRWVEFSRGGIRFGFYAATFGLNSPARLRSSRLQLNLMPGLAPDPSLEEPDLREARGALHEMEKEKIDIKIISLHWGHEFEYQPTTRQRNVAKQLALAGADVIAGSHPHVIQPPEIFPGAGGGRTIVFYSLGNFASAMFTTACRLAAIWPVDFFRGPHDRVEWRLRPPLFFFNKNAGGGRELIPLADYAMSKREKRRIHATLKRLCLSPEDPLG